MNKYCKFLKDIYDGDQLVWEKGQEYFVTYADNESYTFGNHFLNEKGGFYAIDKKAEGDVFIVIERV